MMGEIRCHEYDEAKRILALHEVACMDYMELLEEHLDTEEMVAIYNEARSEDEGEEMRTEAEIQSEHERMPDHFDRIEWLRTNAGFEAALDVEMAAVARLYYAHQPHTHCLTCPYGGGNLHHELDDQDRER